MTARKAFVAGWPVSHSRSPLIHRFWLERYGIEGDYLSEAVPPLLIGDFLRDIRRRGYVGGNITLPHKEAAFAACREMTPIARRLKAVNTVWLDGDVLRGDNTDAFGFAANLDQGAPDWRSASLALVIGAGGASRAVADALVEAGLLSVVVLNRTKTRAADLARRYGGRVTAGGLDEMPNFLPRADLIVNATSGGMTGEAGVDVDWRAARRDAIATDLVYVPLVTPFLKAAAERGLRTVDGLGMLLHQAVPGFERWFGIRPTVDAELRDIVVADIER
ncbi:MAG TPA: shikimate dehydrogenase [Propylenella sp.]